ncbi:hypothetical protein [Xenorhabdus entomophaga]|uniref:hypothetical protein n=1 Tax=Xenorhabdus entomophaga TaxID=3136257 RepID=UPI0030F43654
MFFKIGSTIVSPEQENINIPVEVFKGNPKDGGCFITGLSPDVHIIYHAAFNADKPLSVYFKEAEEYAARTIKELND